MCKLGGGSFLPLPLSFHLSVVDMIATDMTFTQKDRSLNKFILIWDFHIKRGHPLVIDQLISLLGECTSLTTYQEHFNIIKYGINYV